MREQLLTAQWLLNGHIVVSTILLNLSAYAWHLFSHRQQYFVICFQFFFPANYDVSKFWHLSKLKQRLQAAKLAL